MAITKALQARQLYKNGKRVGFFSAGLAAGDDISPGTSSQGGTQGGGYGRGDADGPNRQQKAPKKQKAPKRKPKKNKKNKAPTLNFFERFRLAGLKNLYDQKSGNKKPGIGFSNLLNYANPSLDFYESTSDTDIMDTGYGLSGKNLTDMDRLADAINLGEKTGNLNQKQFEEAFYGPEGNKFIPSEIGENDIYIPPTIEEKEEEKEEDVPIAYRFMADGGRAAFQEGGGIFPRIDKLGNKVSSAEQELAAINSRLDTAQSSLGGQGGQNGGGGIMNNSILPDSPFPSMDEPVEEGDMNNSILPDSPFPNVAEPENTIADNISVNPVGFPENNAPIADNISVGGGRPIGGGGSGITTLPDGTPYDPGRPIVGGGRPIGGGSTGGDPFDPRFTDNFGPGGLGNNMARPGVDLQTLPPTSGELQPLPGFNNRRPMPFELQGPGTGNAPPMTQLGQYTPTTPGELSPIPEGVGPRIPRLPPGLSGAINQGSGMNLGVGGGQLLNAGPRIPQPTITPGPNLQSTPLQTAISGGGLANLGYGKPANMMSPAVGDPRTGAQQVDGNLAQMMMRGGFAEGGMPEYEGGIMDLESGRQQYFLGKLVKKATRAIKKVAKSPFGKAALMYAGGTFLGGLGGMGAKQGFLANLRSGKGISSLFNMGKNSLLGTATMKQGGKQISGGLLNLIKNNKALSGIIGGSLLTGLTAPKSTYNAEEEDDFDLNIPEQYRFYADGGRIGYGSGSGKDFSKSKVYQKWVQRYESNPDSPLVTMHEKADAFKNFYERSKNAQAEGSKEPVAKETMPLLDMNNQEMDLRQEGGFVPIGRMEKADDVPARLSKNEFVFTADAVRNAGEGDIDKGAEVMYNMMKNLESGGEVSEESQGLDGAREMFQTSQRLEEVL